MKTPELLEHIRKRFDLPDIKLFQKCSIADEDHRKDPRVHAHVFHRKGKVICLCGDFHKLLLGHRIGVLLHEIGHLMSGGGEAEADLWVQDHLGIDIDFRNLLQWVAPACVGLRHNA